MQEDDAQILIGKPITATEIFILSEAGQLCPIGVTGEICITGAGLAKQYLNNPELTAQKFIPNPYRPGCLMYRTGDLGRWLPQGEIQYIGRRDEQLKIRGYRIEPGEIENALLSHPDITNAVVNAVTSKDGEKALVAYLVGSEHLSTADIRNHIARQLPAHMLPVHYVQLETFPLTTNGKVDKKKLPAPSNAGLDQSTTYVSPTNVTEQQLANIWQDILGKEKVGIYDNFFDLGGHSLTAIRLASQLQRAFHVKVDLRDIFSKKRLADQAKLIQVAAKADFVAIAPAPSMADYPLSSAQRRLWVLSQFEQGSVAYNIPGVYNFEGALDNAALSFAFRHLIQRHESLRTVFRQNDQGEPRQIILPADTAAATFQINYKDFQEKRDQQALLHRHIQNDLWEPFDLGKGPLIRATLFQVATNRWIFTYVMHHICSDGWSMEILIRELLLLYNAYLKGEQPILAALTIQYKDFACWQRDQLQGEQLQLHRNYWIKQLEGPLPVLELPLDKSRPAVKTYNGSSIYRGLPARLTAELKKICREQDATLFMGLLAAVSTLIHHYSGQQDIIIGSPVAGRQHADLDNQIGFYLNTLALRMRLNQQSSFTELLQQARQLTLDAYQHQVYPFDQLIDDLQLQRDMSRSPLFDVLIDYHDSKNRAQHTTQIMEDTKLKISSFGNNAQPASKFDLTFMFIEAQDGLNLLLEYNTDLFEHETAERMFSHLEEIMAAVVANQQQAISRLEYISSKERELLLNVFNTVPEHYSGYQPVVRLFREQAQRLTEKPSLLWEDHALSYRELNKVTDRLAAHLLHAYNIQTGDRIAVMMDRSDKLIIAILAILKAGAAFVPIDPAYPPARKQFIVEDAAVQLIITQTDYIFDIDYYQGPLFAIDAQLEGLAAVDDVSLPSEFPADALAYVIYTSGSTGQPKGCAITNGNLSHYTRWANSYYFGQGTPPTFGWFTSIAFDLSITSIFCPLTSGGELFIYEQHRDIQSILQHCCSPESGINALKITPSHVNLIAQLELDSTGIKTAILGGEQVTKEQVRILKSLNPDMAVYNEYGPTEATVGCIVKELQEDDAHILIGKPITATEIFILGEAGQLCPIGVAGEICIAGAGLAKQYLNNPELTAQKFIPNPYSPGSLMYRTGDLGRWLPQGEIQYIGRKDEQLKIRGYRIEPGEIESCLQGYSGITNVLVDAATNSSGEKGLIAYIVGEGPLQTADLRDYLAGLLPAYMLPSHFVQLEALPLTINGKVDRKMLPGLRAAGQEEYLSYVAPDSDTEQLLANIWQEILGRERVGTRDSFFDLGGDSIKILRMLAVVRKQLHLDIPVADVYKHPTIAALLANTLTHHDDRLQLQMERQQKEAAVRAEIESLKESILPRLTDRENIADIYPMSDIEKGMVFSSMVNQDSGMYHDQMVHRRLFPDFDINRFQLALQLLSAKHPILRTAFNVSDFEREVQIVYKEVVTDLVYQDISFRDRVQQQEHVRLFLAEEMRRPFDLSLAPLWRMAAFNLGNGEIVFVFQCHHAIIDGWSDALFMTELNNLYLKLATDSTYIPDPIKVSYKDFIIQHELDKQDQGTRDFWQQELKNAERLEIFTQEQDLQLLHHRLDTNLLAKLENTAINQGTTVKVISLSAYLYLLKILNYDPDILTGLVTNMRPNSEDSDKLLGCFLNTIPFNIHINERQTGAELIAAVHQQLITLKDRERLSMFEIARIHNKQQEAGNPFFDVLFDFVDFHVFDSVKEEAIVAQQRQSLSSLEVTGGIDLTNTFLDFMINRTGGNYVLTVRLTRKLKAGLNVEQLVTLFCNILEHIVTTPDLPVYQADYITAAEKRLLLNAFNTVPEHYTGYQPAVSLFREQAIRNPELSALLWEGGSITYKALDDISDHLAAYLLRKYNIQTGDRIAVMMDRSDKLIIAILAILKAGAAFVPIDPAYPPARKQFIVEDAAVQLIITQTDYIFDIDYYQGPLFAIDAQLEGLAAVDDVSLPSEFPADALAYVIYTSGSTGQPKGCAITNGNLSHYTRWANSYYFGQGTPPTFGWFTSIAFDLSITSIFCPLTSGGELFIYEQHRDIQSILQHCCSPESGINALKITPSHVNLIAQLELDSTGIKTAILGGEQVTKEQVRILKSLNPDMAVYNEYGPTEATVGCIVKELQEDDAQILIGKPITATEIFILGEAGQLCPIGVAGEICIAGAGLAKQYLNNPELTAQKFIPNPYRPGSLMYRTGDLGRWLPQGEIQYIGRKDEQLKIRGYRIEPGEIENALLTLSDITAAVVTCISNTVDEKELVAYLTAKRQLDTAEIRNHLIKLLPAHMLPVYYVQLENMPLTTNGKADKKMLPIPAGIDSTTGSYVPPSNDIEQQLVNIWQEILGKDTIGIKDNFFMLGGHSLTAIRLIARIKKEFSTELNIKDVFAEPTIETLADIISNDIWLQSSLDEDGDVYNEIKL
ncbi:non-ribosomal peptide synthetase [uncultured Chitinophaga sp.]|uniref:non-ribosomal peptide synthetase n=1 Tax=uncultured Chitinophaga sp. TaxID=339340 RepID=UPI00260E68EC|nr:non-ribosomal peptide synthetase [uncultured Chitinophaga sp.]